MDGCRDYYQLRRSTARRARSTHLPAARPYRVEKSAPSASSRPAPWADHLWMWFQPSANTHKPCHDFSTFSSTASTPLVYSAYPSCLASASSASSSSSYSHANPIRPPPCADMGFTYMQVPPTPPSYDTNPPAHGESHAPAYPRTLTQPQSLAAEPVDEADTEPELVGLGLYDNDRPPRSSTCPPLGQASTGLTLEEAWQPVASDDEYDADEENDAESLAAMEDDLAPNSGARADSYLQYPVHNPELTQTRPVVSTTSFRDPYAAYNGSYSSVHHQSSPSELIAEIEPDSYAVDNIHHAYRGGMPQMAPSWTLTPPFYDSYAPIPHQYNNSGPFSMGNSHPLVSTDPPYVRGF